VIGKLHIVAKLLDDLFSLAYGVLVVHLPELRMGIATEFLPAQFAQEESTIVSNHPADVRAMHDHIFSRKETIDHIGIISTEQLEILDDAEDRQVPLLALSAESVLVHHVVPLPLVKSSWRWAKSGNPARQMFEDHVLGRHTEPINIEIGGFIPD